MPAVLTAATFADALAGCRRLYWPGCAGHSQVLEAWLRDAPMLAAGRWFAGVWIPGVNRFDPTALHAQARAASIFLAPDHAAAQSRGAFDHLPLHYSEAVHWLRTAARFDAVLLQVAPPDAHGRCSLGVACDFTPAVLQGLAANARVLAHVNPQMPRTAGPWVAADRIDAWVVQEAGLPGLDDGVPDAALQAVARRVAAHVDDGDVLQLGLGKLQGAVLAALHSHRRLRIHAGMVTDGLLPLRDAGALAADTPVTTGVALGGAALYAACADPALVRFAPVEFTHAHATLAALPKLVAINSALEIDLWGQVNCEALDGRVVSGVGGLVDFVRGARASAGGRAIIAGTATVGRSGRSRIVPRIVGAPVALTRHDVDLVVTEHGSAALRGLPSDARARALIDIAAPEHREWLARAWHNPSHAV